MRSVAQDPGYDYDFYQKGVYENPLHHIDNPATPRLFLVKGLVDFVFKHEKVKTILDLGCGDGGLLEQIHRREKYFTGIDLSKSNCEFAEKRLGARARILNEDFTTRENEADLIIICETLEHLPDPLSLLRNLKCSYLIVSVPLGETKEKHSDLHLWAWNEEELVETMKKYFDIQFHIRVNNRTQIMLCKKS